VRDAAGLELTDASVTWTVEDTSVAAVTADGRVRGLTLGETVAHATLGTLSQAATLRVFEVGSGFRAELDSLVWLAYAPTAFDPGTENFPSLESIRADLVLALEHGFTGLITYAADTTLAHVPRIARDVGFEAVIMGMFMFDETKREMELANAIAAAPYVDGYGVGSEGLTGCGGRRYDPEVLIETMSQLRIATGRLVTTSEQIEDYLDDACLDGLLLEIGDWYFPTIHPFRNFVADPQEAAAMAAAQFDALVELTGGRRPVFAKETGWPTCGDFAATEANQAAYFEALSRTEVRSAIFEAFDQPYKRASSYPWESCWGVFDSDRSPKEVVSSYQGLLGPSR
jgi:exo-beta-1,3-glucanase (GH17 family)